MSTYTRTDYFKRDVRAVRCDNHTEYDPQGFAINAPGDPDGDRCWWPGDWHPCETCLELDRWADDGGPC
jgi:hypothetical protein